MFHWLKRMLGLRTIKLTARHIGESLDITEDELSMLIDKGLAVRVNQNHATPTGLCWADVLIALQSHQIDGRS